MPGCNEHGLHKAPKHRGLNEYYYFCLEHVREYNKAWDFFDGMASHEVEDHINNSIYGHRPTWRFDMNQSAEDVLKQRVWETYSFAEGASTSGFHGQTEGPHINHNTAEYEAMAVMGLEPPLSFDVIRTRYKELAKKHHPDLNKGSAKSEELLKRINMAYTILKLAYEQYEKLPER